MPGKHTDAPAREVHQRKSGDNGGSRADKHEMREVKVKQYVTAMAVCATI